MNLADFLLARIAEDEHAARQSFALYGSGSSLYVARHDPARVLAECDAKRRIVETCTYESRERVQVRQGVYEYRPVRRPNDWADDDVSPVVLAALALPYAEHPSYRPQWRP